MSFKLDFEKLRRSLHSKRSTENSGAHHADYSENYKNPFKDVRGIVVSSNSSAPAVLVADNERKQQQQQQELLNSELEQEGLDLLSPISLHSLNKRKRKGFFNPDRKPYDEQNYKRINEISGYFVTRTQQRQQIKKNKSKEVTATALQFPTSSSPPPIRNSILVHHALSGGGAEGKRALRNAVTFYGDEASIPQRKLHYRDGSLYVDIPNMANLPRKELNLDDDDPYDPDEDDPVITQLDEVIDSLRERDLPEKDETIKEYNTYRKNFWIIFSLYSILATFSCILLLVFIFHYNYGFAHPPTESFQANSSVYIHEWSRTYLNAHMFIMVATTTHLLSLSTLTYRVFPNTSRTKLIWYHGSLNMIGSVLSIVGLGFAYYYHELTQRPHFASFHTYIGVFAVLNQWIALFAGLIFILPCFSWNTRISIASTHKTVGSMLLLSNAAAIITGCVTFAKKFFDVTKFPQFYSTSYHVLHGKTICLNLLGLLVLVSVGVMLYIQTNYLFRHRRKPTASGSLEDFDGSNLDIMMMKADEARAKKSDDDEWDWDAIQLGSKKSFQKPKSFSTASNNDEMQSKFEVSSADADGERKKSAY